MLDLSPGDTIIKTYLKDIQHLEEQQITHELGIKGPFQNLLDKAAKKRGWTLVPELSTYSGGKRVVPDGTVRDEFRLARGWWEAKDTSDRLAAEIQKSSKPAIRTATRFSRIPTQRFFTRIAPKQASIRFASRSKSRIFSTVSSLTTNPMSVSSIGPWTSSKAASPISRSRSMNTSRKRTSRIHASSKPLPSS